MKGRPEAGEASLHQEHQPSGQVPLFGEGAASEPALISVAQVVALLCGLRYRARQGPSEARGTYWFVGEGVELVSVAGEYFSVEPDVEGWTAGGERVETMEEVERALALEPVAAPRRRRLAVLDQVELPDPELAPWIVAAEELRPRTWGECRSRLGGELCPFVSCRHHLWSDGADSQKLFEQIVEDLHPDDVGETCSLRVAENVEVGASEGGKWVGRSITERGCVGHPPPEVAGAGAGRSWHELAPAEREPRQVDAAVIGRFLRVSRELVRLELNSAVAKLLADPSIQTWAEAFELRDARLSESCWTTRSRRDERTEPGAAEMMMTWEEEQEAERLWAWAVTARRCQAPVDEIRRGSTMKLTPGTPTDFNPWEALVELGAGLLLVDGGRWVCVVGEHRYASDRTNGGFGIVWADVTGMEAVWLAWEAGRGRETYPRGVVSEVWDARLRVSASLRPPRVGETTWRAWTWERGASGLLEPALVFDAEDPEHAVWEVFASSGLAVSA